MSITFTTYGLEAIAAASAGQTKITFTELKTSDTGTLTTGTYPDFTSIKQSVNPSSVSMDKNTRTAVVSGLFSNAGLASAYNIKAVGLYATCAGSYAMSTPRLFAYEKINPAQNMPLPSTAPTSYSYQFNTTIANSTSVTVEIEQGDYALASDLQEMIDDVPIFGFIEATHSKSGTTHNLSVPDATAENIKFIATANFGEGDTVTINGVPFGIINTMPGAGFFLRNNIVNCFVNYANNTVFFSKNNTELYWCPSCTEVNEIYAWLNSFTPGKYLVGLNANEAGLLGMYAEKYIGEFIFAQSAGTIVKQLILWSSTSNQKMYSGQVNNNTGAVDMNNMGCQLQTLTGSDVANMTAFLSFIDRQNLGFATFYISSANSARIGLNNTPHILYVSQLNDFGQACTIVAIPSSYDYPIMRIMKSGSPSSVWDANWSAYGATISSITLSENTLAGLYGYCIDLQKGEHNISLTRSQSSGLGLGNKSYFLTIRKNTNDTCLLEAQPWDNPLIKYYSNIENSTLVPWKKVTLTPDNV